MPFSLQNYLLSKKSQMSATKSQYFATRKESKDNMNQMQRKLTYNMVHPAEQTHSELNIVHAEEISASKSEKINENLKKTASSTSSSVLTTIDKIKRMHSLGGRNSVTPSKLKNLSISDFTILKYL